MRNHNQFDQHGDLRDIFAAVAMIGLMNDKTATPAWVATQAYAYAAAMLEVRDAVSDTKENK